MGVEEVEMVVGLLWTGGGGGVEAVMAVWGRPGQLLSGMESRAPPGPG